MNKNVKIINKKKIKGRTYIVDNYNIYYMNDDGMKGEIYGTYINGKFKKNK